MWRGTKGRRWGGGVAKAGGRQGDRKKKRVVGRKAKKYRGKLVGGKETVNGEATNP